MALASPAEEWSGRLPVHNASPEVAALYLIRSTTAGSPAGASAGSPYRSRFAAGATKWWRQAEALVRPLQGRGERNPRDFDKYIFQLPIPLYDPESAEHRQFVELAERAERVAGEVELPHGVAFQALRRRIRTALADDGVGRDINELTEALLSSPAGER